MPGSFCVHILGCGSAMPTTARLSAAQILQCGGRLYMIDCGEGAQRQLRFHKLGFGNLRVIFISHLHGDHCLGLPGLLSTLGLMGYNYCLTIVGPKGIERYVSFLQETFLTESLLQIKVVEVDHKTSAMIYEDKYIEVLSLPLEHRIETVGFRFTERVPKRKIDPIAIQEASIPYAYYRLLQEGNDYTAPDGRYYANEQLTVQGRKPCSYTYCSDTVFLPHLAPLIADSTLLYHEATYGEEFAHRLSETGHSSATQAAQMALLAKVGKLIIGHYSSRYKNTDALLEEAQRVFPQTIAAQDGLVISIDSSDPLQINVQQLSF